MSQLTRCNYCTLRDIQAFALQTNQKVELVPATMSSQNHLETDLEDGKVVARKIDGTDVLVGGVYIAWLWKIPEYCVCFKQP